MFPDSITGTLPSNLFSPRLPEKVRGAVTAVVVLLMTTKCNFLQVFSVSVE